MDLCLLAFTVQNAWAFHDIFGTKKASGSDCRPEAKIKTEVFLRETLFSNRLPKFA
jgi:hypothetical protein